VKRPSQVLHCGAQWEYERQKILIEKRLVQTAFEEKLFPPRTVRCWKMLLREVVQCPFLEGFKTQMEKALSNLT